MPPEPRRTVIPGRSLAAPQARSSPSEVVLSASHHCQAPTENLRESHPLRHRRRYPNHLGRPRDLLCSLPSANHSANPFLCLAISEAERLCRDLNLLFHSPYALQRSCKCPAGLSSPASIPTSFPQRAEGSSQISHPDLDRFSKVSAQNRLQSSSTK